jgi:ribonucleoside-diphosphate reductase alpha chain
MAINEQELYGPRTEFSRWIHADRHRGPEETYDDYAVRYCRAVARDSDKIFRRALHHIRHQSILPGGRQQVSVGRPFATTAFNCFVGPQIPDSLSGIFDTLRQGAITMGAGGGIGWDFSTIRPEGEVVRGLGGMGSAAGPIHFMRPFNEMCKILVRSWARGAMMATLRVDHPDIIKFVNAKRSLGTLEKFNISVCVPDSFIEALARDGTIDLQFNGQKFGEARAWDIWGPIMESNWDWAEPGVIFIDRINRLNPLYYAEQIYSTNPCAEQPLPPHGCCLLGSYNLVKYLTPRHESLPSLDESNPQIVQLHKRAHSRGAPDGQQLVYDLDWEYFDEAVEMSVRAYDNVIDRSSYPLPEQRAEEMAKRRMGIGPTAMANCLEIMGLPYASRGYIEMQDKILQRAANTAYKTSSQLAREKGKFPLFVTEKYCEGEFFKSLNDDVQWDIVRYGLRNSHLTSIAPTGTISLDADNVSGGIEPVFAYRQQRKVDMPRLGIVKEIELLDYAFNFYKVEGRTADQVTPEEHVRVQCGAQKWIDSSISKTCNVNGQVSGEGPGITFSEFENIYLLAWVDGAKSCTTYNINGKRSGVISASPQVEAVQAVESLQPQPQDAIEACFIDPLTGIRSCEA